MAATGTAIIDFGTYPGDQRAVVTVNGQSSILAGSAVEAWLMSDTSADHSAYEHSMVPMMLRCGNVVAGAGFDVVGTCANTLTGQWAIRWVWS